MAEWNPQANEIFLDAMEIQDPAERKRLIDERCDGEPALKKHVVSLLQAGEETGGLLAKPAIAVDGTTGPQVPLLRISSGELSSTSTRSCRKLGKVASASCSWPNNSGR